MDKNFIKTAAIFVSLFLCSAIYALTSDEILREIDGHRVVGDSFEMTFRIESYLDDRLDNYAVMDAQIRGGKAERILFLEPEAMKGRKVIMRGEDMFMIIPDTKNPVRITPSQRLMAGISYSDMAKMSFSEDYRSTIKTELPIAGMDTNGRRTGPINCILLELKAKKREATYDRIMLWVDKALILPVKAEFFALSGKKTMTAYYTAPKQWNGRTIISKMYIYDQVQTAYHTMVEYLDMKTNAADTVTNGTANAVSGKVK